MSWPTLDSVGLGDEELEVPAEFAALISPGVPAEPTPAEEAPAPPRLTSPAGDLTAVTPVPDSSESTAARFRPVTDADLRDFQAANTSKSTDKQTKWAVKMMKGAEYILFFSKVGDKTWDMSETL